MRNFFLAVRFQGSHLVRLMIHEFKRFSWELQSKETSGNEMGTLSSNNTIMLIPFSCHMCCILVWSLGYDEGLTSALLVTNTFLYCSIYFYIIFCCYFNLIFRVLSLFTCMIFDKMVEQENTLT